MKEPLKERLKKIWAHPGLSKKRNIVERMLDMAALVTFVYGVGEGLTGMVTSILMKFFYLGGSVLIIKTLFHINLTPTITIIIVVSWVLFSIGIGYLHLEKGFYKRQQIITTLRGNPFFAELKENIEKIKQKLGIKDK